MTCSHSALYTALQSLVDTIPSRQIPGFEGYNESDLPFYCKDVSFERYGRWKLDRSLQRKCFWNKDPKDYPWELVDTIRFPDILLELDKVKCASMSEWLDIAQVIIQEDSNVSYI